MFDPKPNMKTSSIVGYLGQEQYRNLSSYSAIVRAENEDWEKTAGALAERRAVTLVAEELMLLVR